MSNIIEELNSEQMTKEIPEFSPGDTVVVQVKVKEGTRERLQALWEGRHVSNERLIAQLKEWCAQAEASGIKVLQDYARALKHYTVAPA